MTYEVIVDNEARNEVGDEAGSNPRRLELKKNESGWSCRIDGRAFKVDAIIPRQDILSLIIDGGCYEIKREQTATELYLWVGTTRFVVELRDPRSLRSRQRTARNEKGPIKILAPMPGRVVRVLITENHEVEAGQGLLVVEAMKMQNEIKSPKKGTVKKISVSPGAAVNPGDILAIVE
jgi:biotin carboxyl carrier protein